MKYLANILAFYMMALFIMPCDDLSKQEGFQTKNFPQQTTQQEQHDHEQNNDFCSPFCLCNCCSAVSGIVMLKNIFDVKSHHNFDLPKPKTHYKSVDFPNYIEDIWQPPKITV
ncbi:MAG TPA: DUF6660 family protein [Moheibacter sp.]|nr:DUF6660 family protein [Moheibacter sp.]